MATEEKKQRFKEALEQRRLRNLIQTDLSKSEYEDEMLCRGYDEKIFISNWTESLVNEGHFSY